MNIQNCGNQAKQKSNVLFFGRAGCEASSKALSHLIRLGFDVTSIFSEGRKDSLAEEIQLWSGDYIICFRSMLILPINLISKAKIAAINFHPGSPEYPGSACLNYALYENSKDYGVTAHLMTERVDDGPIINCRRFLIHKSDTVDSLLERTHLKLLDLFFDVTSELAISGNLFIDKSINKFANEKWSGVKRKIKDLDRLSIIDQNTSKKELEDKIRATHTKCFPTRIILHGYEFILKLDNNKLDQ